MLGSLPSSIFNKEFWFQVKPDCLLSEANNYFYCRDSAELSVAASMKQVSEACLLYYHKNKDYPTSLDEISDVNFGYLNSYIGRPDKPLLKCKQVICENEQEAERMVQSTIDKMRNGGLFDDEPRLYPGCINALCIKTKSNDGRHSYVLIHGCDGNGKLLLSANGNSNVYLIAQHDGRLLSLNSNTHLFARSFAGLGRALEIRPTTICMLREPDDLLPFWLMKYRGVLGFCTIGTLLLGCVMSISNKTSITNIGLLSGLIYYLLAILSGLSSIMP